MDEKPLVEEDEESRLERLLESASSLLVKYRQEGRRRLRTEDQQPVRQAIRGMAVIGGERVDEQLYQLITQVRNPLLLKEAADALCEVGRPDDAAQLIIRVFRKIPPNPRARAFYGLRSWGWQDSFVRLMGCLGEPYVLPLLTTLMEEYIEKGEYSDRAIEVARALGNIGNHDIFELLIRVIVRRNVNPAVAGAAGRSLREMWAHPHVITLLENAVKEHRLNKHAKIHLEKILSHVRDSRRGAFDEDG